MQPPNMSVAAKEFIENSKLDILIPQATGVDIEEAFASSDGSDYVGTASLIEQRSLLFFDESLHAYIALRTPYKDEAHLKSYLTRLVINLEVQAHGFQASPSGGQDGSRGSSPVRNEDILWSGTLATSEDPVIIVQEEIGQRLGRQVLVIWRATIAISGRPRMRIQSPVIVFKSSATLKLSKKEHIHELRDPILPSRVPNSINLLEPLKGDPILQGAVPKLSASRLLSVKRQVYDETTGDDEVNLSAQKAFRALPAISSRVKYSRPSGHIGRPSVIASLDIEAAPFSGDDIKITKINMQLSDGSAERLGSEHTPQLPLTCRTKDNPVFLYRLTPNDALSDIPSSSSARTVLITVYALVLVSETCSPNIEMRWKTAVDFSTALNPTYGAPRLPMQRPRRPSSLSRAPASLNTDSQPASAGKAEPSAKSSSNQGPETAVPESNFDVSITFAAPKTVRVGRPFSWDVLVLNRSTKPRQLILTMPPKRKKGFTEGHLSKASSSSAGAHRNDDTAEAVVDENVLYAMQRNAGNEPARVIRLSTDVRIGPLGPGSCLSTELKFLPLAEGHLHVEAVRIIDVASNDFVDVRDLPDIVAEGQNIDR